MSKSGQKLIILTKKKDPFAENCSGNDCPPCENLQTEGKISRCKIDNVTYQGICKTCGDEGKVRIYDGETARNLHVRSKEHINEYNRNNENNWMIKHVNNDHEGKKENVQFIWKVLKKHRKPLERQISEAVNISKKKEDENLNSKSEFNHQTIKRISLDGKNKMKIHCKTCGSLFDHKEKMKEHIEMFHENQQCETCEYEAIGSKDLKYHAKVAHK